MSHAWDKTKDFASDVANSPAVQSWTRGAYELVKEACDDTNNWINATFGGANSTPCIENGAAAGAQRGQISNEASMENLVKLHEADQLMPTLKQHVEQYIRYTRRKRSRRPEMPSLELRPPKRRCLFWFSATPELCWFKADDFLKMLTREQEAIQPSTQPAMQPAIQPAIYSLRQQLEYDRDDNHQKHFFSSFSLRLRSLDLHPHARRVFASSFSTGPSGV
jgi:hypothetical protein